MSVDTQPVVEAEQLGDAKLELAVRILDEHFESLGAVDRYADTLHFVEPLLKRLAMGLTASQIEALLGRRLTHINYPTFRALVTRLAGLGPLSVLETGSSAHGTNSSALFARLVRAMGGRFVTVDLNPATAGRAAAMFRELGCDAFCRAICSDSAAYIHSAVDRFNVVYLDSFDLVPAYFEEAEQHGLSEFKLLVERGLLDPRESYVLIDDTPRTIEVLATQAEFEYLVAARQHVVRHGHLPGKGALVAEYVRGNGAFEILAWDYQLLIRHHAAGSPR